MSSTTKTGVKPFVGSFDYETRHQKEQKESQHSDHQYMKRFHRANRCEIDRLRNIATSFYGVVG